MNHAGIPKKRQAAPQAPPRDFKPRKNGTPAVPATPPANMPRPAPAPQMQQPPMRGAAQSVGRAPQRAPQRAQGRFNPMQGPMGAGMDRARQAAATMFMDRAPKPMQPSMPQQPKTPPPAMPQAMPQRQMQPAAQSAMQRAPQEAPKPQQTSQPQDFSPAQRAAFDIADMVPGDMQAFSGDFRDTPAPEGPPPGSMGQEDPSGGDNFNMGSESLLDQAMAMGQAEAESFANKYIEEFGLMGFVNAFGREKYDAIFGEGASEQAMKDEFDEAMATRDSQKAENMAQLLSAMPDLATGVDASALGEMGPELAQSLLGAADGNFDMENLDQNLVNAILGGLIGENEGLFTDDELSAQAQTLKKEADAAKQKLAMQMAMRGMGASGLAGAGFGNIDSKLIDAINELAISSKAQGAELGLNQAQIAAGLFSALQSDETRRLLAEEALDYQKEQDALSNAEVWQNNAAAKLGADGWADGQAGKVSELLAKGVPWYEIEKRLKTSADNEVFLDLGPGDETLLLEQAASGDGPGNMDENTAFSIGDRFVTLESGTFPLNPDGSFVQADDLTKLWETGDETFASSVEAAWEQYGAATGKAPGDPKAWWDDITNEDGNSPYSEQERRDALRFVAAQMGYGFPPPGVSAKGWYGMPEALRKDYWETWEGTWNPYEGLPGGESEPDSGEAAGSQQEQGFIQGYQGDQDDSIQYPGL